MATLENHFSSTAPSALSDKTLDALDGSAECPFVSVIIPVHNETNFIDDLIRAVMAQDYPAERLEVLVADGMSTDGTREKLAALQNLYAELVVVDNPDRIVSTGLNAALGKARGDIIVRIDGHSLPAPNFLRENVALLLEHPEAWSVGGPIWHTAVTPFGKAVAVAMSHPLGVGNARHRYPMYEGYVEGAQFPAIRRWVFNRVGSFDTRMVRNQDDEFNYRITQAGGRIYVSPRVRCAYFVRERISQLFRQYFQYGFWRIPVIEKHRRPTTWRQMTPTLFYVACVVLMIAGLWWRQPAVAIGLPLVYAVALLAAAVTRTPNHGVLIASQVPIAMATMHAGYGLGLAYGIWARFFRPGAWDTKSQMAKISR